MAENFRTVYRNDTIELINKRRRCFKHKALCACVYLVHSVSATELLGSFPSLRLLCITENRYRGLLSAVVAHDIAVITRRGCIELGQTISAINGAYMRAFYCTGWLKARAQHSKADWPIKFGQIRRNDEGELIQRFCFCCELVVLRSTFVFQAWHWRSMSDSMWKRKMSIGLAGFHVGSGTMELGIMSQLARTKSIGESSIDLDFFDRLNSLRSYTLPTNSKIKRTINVVENSRWIISLMSFTPLTLVYNNDCCFSLARGRPDFCYTNWRIMGQLREVNYFFIFL